jgi:hypothetical protein
MLTLEGIRTTTAVFPWDNPCGHDFISQFPGAANMDHCWAENMTLFRAWWNDAPTLSTRDQEMEDDLRHGAVGHHEDLTHAARETLEGPGAMHFLHGFSVGNSGWRLGSHASEVEVK